MTVRQSGGIEIAAERCTRFARAVPIDHAAISARARVRHMDALARFGGLAEKDGIEHGGGWSEPQNPAEGTGAAVPVDEKAVPFFRTSVRCTTGSIVAEYADDAESMPGRCR
jgi:hypothetical protein